MNVCFRVSREYARRYQAGRLLTKTSIARDLILNGYDNEFIRRVILAALGEYWENRSINRVRKILEKSFTQVLNEPGITCTFNATILPRAIMRKT